MRRRSSLFKQRYASQLLKIRSTIRERKVREGTSSPFYLCSVVKNHLKMTENDSNNRGGFTKYGFRLLNSTNYDHWRQKMYFLLYKENLWDITETPAPTQIIESWTTRNRQAVSIIGLGIEDAQLKHIVGLTTAHEIWTTFEKIYSTVNISSRHHLHRKFAQSKWTSGTIVEYVDYM